MGCSSGGGISLVISSIEGPIEIDEYSTAQYNITAGGDTGIQYAISVLPSSAATIQLLTSSSVRLHAEQVSSDTQFTIQVVVTSDNTDPQTVMLEVTISDNPDEWTHTIGGNWEDKARGMVIDEAGNIYVTGFYYTTVDFNPGQAGDLHTSNGIEDAFLLKLNRHGDYQWVRTWGGPGIDSGNQLAMTPDGNICVVGWSMDEVDFDPGPGVVTYDWEGATDMFVSSFTPAGDLVWAIAWGGMGWDIIHGLGIAQDGSIYLGVEYFRTVDFDPGPGVDEYTSNGHAEAALVKLTKDGDYVWTHSWGSVEGDGSDGIVFDHHGNLYMTGDFSFTVDFDPGPGVDERTSNGERDVFLIKFNASDEYQWVRTWGSAGPTTASWDKGNGIGIDSNGNVYSTGMFTQTVDFDAGPDTHIVTSNGGADVFVTKYDPEGNFQWVSTWGGPEWDLGVETAVSSSGLVYVVGTIQLTADLDPGPGVQDYICAGKYDSFITCLDGSGNWRWSQAWGDTSWDNAHCVVTDVDGAAIVVGAFQGTNDFDPIDGIDERTSNGASDIFIRRMSP